MSATATKSAVRIPGPVYGYVIEVSGMARLAAQALGCLRRGPFDWWREAVAQSATTVRRCLLPLFLSTASFVFGAGVMLTAGLLHTLGAQDRLGQGVGISTTREFAGWITGMLVAGIAGTAICSDLGARKVRDEIAALEVLATDPVRALVLPRFIALALMTPLLYMWTSFCGAATGAIGGALVQGIPISSYMASFNTLTPIDVYAAMLKMALIGVLIATVCCYKGMRASGGAEGVGRQVNSAVVIIFATIWVFNFLFNSSYLALFPQAQALR